MANRVAEAFPPGEYIREELEARGWTQADLAEILGRPPRLVNEIIGGTRAITAETARGLSDAFGTDPYFWLNLQGQYDLWRASQQDEVVSRRSRLFSKAPIREMTRRGWIESSENIDVIEKRVCDFFSVKSIEDEPKLGYAAKTSLAEQTVSQRAWLFRAMQLSGLVQVERFTETRFARAVAGLHALMGAPEEARHAPRILAAGGVRLVIVEPLPQTRIDGACFWLNAECPVVALSIRYDRIDSFWHTLSHELGHLAHRHSDIDIDLGKNARVDNHENEANKFADSMLFPAGELADFVARVGPMYSHAKISGFANRLGIHPGIVVGQLQFRGEIGYTHSRAMLVKIRDFVTAAAVTDGWGHILPANLSGG